MSKATVSGVCKTALENSEVAMGLVELHQLCITAGLNVELAQVYAGLQSMASTGKCDRGTEKQTWIKLGAGRGANNKIVSEDVTNETPIIRSRTKISSGRRYTNEEILAAVEAWLGPKHERSKTKLAHCFILLGDQGFEHIQERTRAVLQVQTPGTWFTTKQGAETILGFTKE